MKKKNVIIYALLMMFMSISGAKAQNQLKILNVAGETTSYELAEIKNLTFSEGNLVVEEKMGTTESYGLNNIRYLSFRDFTTGVKTDLEIAVGNNFLLYPNPAKDEISISFESMNEEHIILEIFNLNGKILIQRNLKDMVGKEISKINISHLNSGLYLCRIKGSKIIKTTKFYKN